MKRPTWEAANALGLEVYDRWAATDPDPRHPWAGSPEWFGGAPGPDGSYRGPLAREAFSGPCPGLVDGQPYSGVTLTVRAHGPGQRWLDWHLRRVTLG